MQLRGVSTPDSCKLLPAVKVTTSCFSVRDDGPGLDMDRVRKGAGVGLANTRERLTALYGSRAHLELMAMSEGGALATIRLPFHVLATLGEVTFGS